MMRALILVALIVLVVAGGYFAFGPKTEPAPATTDSGGLRDAPAKKSAPAPAGRPLPPHLTLRRRKAWTS